MHVYERRAGIARGRLQERVLQILEQEKRWLVPMVVVLLAGIALIPVFGLPGLLVSLAILYVGSLGTGIRTMRHAEKVERSFDPRKDAIESAMRAWQSRPSLGIDERAHLVRMMNLSSAAYRPAVRPMLIGELRDIRTMPTLASWTFLADLDDLLRVDAAALAQRPALERSALSAVAEPLRTR